MTKPLNDESETWEEGSTNVFADLGFPDAAGKLAKAELIHKINLILQERGLKQKKAALLLKTDQAKISALNRGQLSLFSIERLVKYLILLNQDVEIVIREAQIPEHHGCLHVSYA